VVKSLRFHKDNYLVFLDGVSTRTQAESFFQKKVFVEEKPVDFVFAEDILGKKAVDLQGRGLGVVAEIMQSPLYDILVVRGEKEWLIPHIERFVKNIAEKITVDVSGLEE
jgi:ribosomal 30S subunit maturation factor RimM